MAINPTLKRAAEQFREKERRREESKRINEGRTTPSYTGTGEPTYAVTPDDLRKYGSVQAAVEAKKRAGVQYQQGITPEAVEIARRRGMNPIKVQEDMDKAETARMEELAGGGLGFVPSGESQYARDLSIGRAKWYFRAAGNRMTPTTRQEVWPPAAEILEGIKNPPYEVTAKTHPSIWIQMGQDVATEKYESMLPWRGLEDPAVRSEAKILRGDSAVMGSYIKEQFIETSDYSWSWKEAEYQGRLGSAAGGSIGLLATAPVGGVGAVPGAVGGYVGGVASYGFGYVSQFITPEESPFPRITEIEPVPFVGFFYTGLRRLTGKQTWKEAHPEIGDVSLRSQHEMLGFIATAGPISSGVEKVTAGRLAVPVGPRVFGVGYPVEGSSKEIMSAYEKQLLGSNKAYPFPTTEVEPGFKVLRQGISFEFKEGKTFGVLSREPGGVKYGWGVKRIDYKPNEIMGIRFPETAAESEFLKKSSGLPSSHKIGGVDVPTGVENVEDVTRVMYEVKNINSRFIQDAFKRETKTLSPKGVDEVLGFAKKTKSTLYGSFAARPQIEGGGRLPADIDLMMGGGGIETAAATKNLVKHLQRVGETVRVSKESPTLIESYRGGGWRHAVDIHFRGQLSASGAAGEFGFGYKLNRPTTQFEGISTQRLNEQVLRKGTSSLGVSSRGIGPEEHRLKDIGDFITGGKTLLKSKPGASSDAWAALGRYEARMKGVIPSERVSLELYAPSKGSYGLGKPSIPRSLFSPPSQIGGYGYSASKSRSKASSSVSSYSLSRSLLYSPSKSISRASASKSPLSFSKISGVSGSSASKSKSGSISMYGSNLVSPSTYSSGPRSSSSYSSTYGYTRTPPSPPPSPPPGFPILPGFSWGGERGGVRGKRVKRRKTAGMVNDPFYRNVGRILSGGKREKQRKRKIRGLIGFERLL